MFGVEFDDVYYDRGMFEFWFLYVFGMVIVVVFLEIVVGVFLILECKKGGGIFVFG